MKAVKRELTKEIFWNISPSLMCVVDLSGVFLQVNPSWRTILGYSPAELIGKNLLEFIHPDDIEPTQAELAKLAAGGRAYQFENRYRGKDGSYHWFSWSAVLCDSQWICGVAVEVTKRKKAEEKNLELIENLRIHQIELESQAEELNQAQQEVTIEKEKYQDLYENAPVGYLTMTFGLSILNINDAAARLLGRERNQLINTRFSRYLVPECMNDFYFHIQKILKTNAHQLCELRLLKADHSQIYVRLDSMAVKDVRGELNQIRIAITDISEQKHAEEAQIKAKAELETKVKERTAELSASEEKYRNIVETASEGIVLMDPQEIITFVNKKYTEMVGYRVEELIGKPVSFTVDKDYKKALKKKLEKRKHGIREEFETMHRRKDGTPMWVIVHGSPLYNDAGKYVGGLGMITDITEEKQLRDQLEEYAKKIVQAQEEERKLIAYELHDDTAQYLAILKLQLDSILHSRKIQDPGILEKLEYLERDAGRAVDDVRRYSHELRPGVLDHLGLQAALEQIAEDTNKLNQVKVQVTVEGKEPPLSDEVKLGLFRIAQEALSNARKHAQAQKAEIILIYQDNQITVTIRDDGTGFNLKEAMTRSSLKGSLGLMSMQERAKLIGANLKIESDSGRGTTVQVEMAL